LFQFANTFDFEAGLAVPAVPVGADFLAEVTADVAFDVDSFL
jgi:hypothetical protein